MASCVGNNSLHSTRFEHAVCNALNLPVKIGFPSVEELNRARNYWIHQLQMAAFPDEW
jgi:hypothetical protein